MNTANLSQVILGVVIVALGGGIIYDAVVQHGEYVLPASVAIVGMATLTVALNRHTAVLTK